jgi:hypothetical protein
VQLVKTLYYKVEGRGFNSQWCHLNFSFTQSFWPHYGPWVDSAFNRNEYQEYFLGCRGGRGVGLTTLPPSWADCLEIWEPHPPGNLRACPGLYRDCFTLLTIYSNYSYCYVYIFLLTYVLCFVHSLPTGILRLP